MKKIILCIAIFSGAISLLHAQTNVGINTTTPSDPLDVNGDANFRGTIKINNNAGQNGQVLTSNGNGTDPQWKSAAYTGGGRFWATIATNSNTASSSSGRGLWNVNADATQEDSVDFATAVVTGSDISVNSTGLINNFIEINKTGLYHFEGTIRMFVTNSNSTAMLPRAYIKIQVNRPTGIDFNVFLIEELLTITGN